MSCPHAASVAFKQSAADAHTLHAHTHVEMQCWDCDLRKLEVFQLAVFTDACPRTCTPQHAATRCLSVHVCVCHCQCVSQRCATTQTHRGTTALECNCALELFHASPAQTAASIKRIVYLHPCHCSPAINRGTRRHVHVHMHPHRDWAKREKKDKSFHSVPEK